jgi:Skp family chaperone for outer membrane proteins
VTRSSRLIAALALSSTIGCADQPLRLATVNLQEWQALKPLPAGPGDSDPQRAAWQQVASFAREHGLNLVLDDEQTYWAASDLDITLLLLGQEVRAPRAGRRIGYVALQRVLERTHEARAARAQLAAELAAKQSELDRLQAELHDRFGADGKSLKDAERAQFESALAALRQRFALLRHELRAHEKEATLELLHKLRPEVEELAHTHGLDAVLDPTATVRHYQRRTHYPPPGPDLTEELIRLHDQHVP